MFFFLETQNFKGLLHTATSY